MAAGTAPRGGDRTAPAPEAILTALALNSRLAGYTGGLSIIRARCAVEMRVLVLARQAGMTHADAAAMPLWKVIRMLAMLRKLKDANV